MAASNATMDDTAQDADPIGQEVPIRRMMDGCLHDGPIDAQLPPLGHLRLACQFHHPIVEGVQRLGPNGLSPALQGAEIGQCLEVHA